MRLWGSGAPETVEVEVAGKRYHIGSDRPDSDLEAVARIVSERIAEIRKASPDMSDERVAILAALNLGEDLLSERADAAAATGKATAAIREARKSLQALEDMEADLPSAPAGPGGIEAG